MTDECSQDQLYAVAASVGEEVFCLLREEICVPMCVACPRVDELSGIWLERWRIPLSRWMDGIEEGWSIPLTLCAGLCATSSGLLLLLLVSVGTILAPAAISIALGTGMPPVWGLQGLFLLAILIVCGARYSIERVASVNRAALVIGITFAATFVVAPVHAFYRNVYPLNEGAQFLPIVRGRMTRQWHARFARPLRAVGGDEDLAPELAFSSPDHPRYKERLVNCGVKPPLDNQAFQNGGAALCFGEDVACIAAAERSASQAPRSVKSEFELQSNLLGQAGAR